MIQCETHIKCILTILVLNTEYYTLILTLVNSATCWIVDNIATHTHTHTHPFNGPLSGTTRVSRYQKGKTNLDFTEARDSERQWHQLGHMQVCTSLQTDKNASNPTTQFFYRSDALPATQPTASKHWRQYSRRSIKSLLATLMRLSSRSMADTGEATLATSGVADCAVGASRWRCFDLRATASFVTSGAALDRTTSTDCLHMYRQKLVLTMSSEVSFQTFV